MYGVESIEQWDDFAVCCVKTAAEFEVIFLLESLAKRGICAEIVERPCVRGGCGEIMFTIPTEKTNECRLVIDEVCAAGGKLSLSVFDGISVLGIRGDGFRGDRKIAAEVLRILWEAGVQYRHVSVNEMKMSVLVEREYAKRAMEALARTLLFY